MPGNPQNTCDSIYHLHIDVYHDEVVTLDAVAECDEYSWHGTTYTTSGICEYQIITPDGCTYTEYLPLTINHSDTIDYTLTACEEYVWHGTTYTQSGNYNYLTTTPEGCTRLERLSLTIGDEYRQVDEISTCGSYFWPVNQQWYYHSIMDSIVHHGACDSTFVLQLDLGNFDSVEISVPEEDHCDGYLWDPQGHVFTTDNPYNPEDYYFTQSGIYRRIYTNSQGCDSIVVLDAQFEYSPDPTEIYPVDGNNEAPHWVITATEFQINSYDFHFWDNNDQCQWESVRWEFENPNIHWILDPDSTTNPIGKACRIYVLEHVEDTVWVRATAYNDCKPEGVSRRYWLLGSFYDTDEQKTEAKIYPNPTDGIFTVEAENIEHIRVFDMMGQILLSDEYDNAYRAVVNLSHLAPGIYQVEIKTSGGIITKRIIRSR